VSSITGPSSGPGVSDVTSAVSSVVLGPAVSGKTKGTVANEMTGSGTGTVLVSATGESGGGGESSKAILPPSSVFSGGMRQRLRSRLLCACCFCFSGGDRWVILTNVAGQELEVREVSSFNETKSEHGKHGP
jgi:hypothetical protein